MACVIAVALAGGTFGGSVAACTYASRVQTPNDTEFGQFKFGQRSQGGNQYYGLAGVIHISQPANPADIEHPYEHVVTQLGSADAIAPGFAYSGYVMGYRAGITYTNPELYAEMRSYLGSISFHPQGPASSGNWYATQVGEPRPGGLWEYRAYKYVGAWVLIATVEISTQLTEQQAFGEATDPTVDRFGNPKHGACRQQSAVGGSNRYSSLQLLIADGAGGYVWQDWTAANGRFVEEVTVFPYDTAQITNYQDRTVGGPD